MAASMRFKSFAEAVTAASDPAHPTKPALGQKSVVVIVNDEEIPVEAVLVSDDGTFQIVAKPDPEFKDHKDDSDETWYREAGLTKAQIAGLVSTDA